MFRTLASAVALAVIAAASAAADRNTTHNDNPSRRTNCQSAGGVVSDVGHNSFVCTLHGDTGVASLTCTEGQSCFCSGSACDEFGGDDALERVGGFVRGYLAVPLANGTAAPTPPPPARGGIIIGAPQVRPLDRGVVDPNRHRGRTVFGGGGNEVIERWADRVSGYVLTQRGVSGDIGPVFATSSITCPNSDGSRTTYTVSVPGGQCVHSGSPGGPTDSIICNNDDGDAAAVDCSSGCWGVTSGEGSCTQSTTPAPRRR